VLKEEAYLENRSNSAISKLCDLHLKFLFLKYPIIYTDFILLNICNLYKSLRVIYLSFLYHIFAFSTFSNQPPMRRQIF